MKQKRSIAAVLLLTLVFSLLHPPVTVQAAPKNFTYAEQRTGATVRSLFLEPGQQVDLKFIGVSDYKNYERRWVSSNENVAVVDSAGLITARAEGTASIKLLIGDSTDYTSTGVTVTVGRQNTIVLGTSGNSTFGTAELNMGSRMDLGFYGMQGWDPERYTCAWISTNPVAATVDQTGIVTPITAGLRTFIMLLITDKYTSSTLTVTPLELNIVDKLNSSVVTPVPTIAPTKVPNTTATPMPTTAPTQTPLDGSYSVRVTSTDSISVTFPSEAFYEKEDISLYLLEKDSDYRIEEECNFDVTWKNNGTEAVIETESTLYHGDKYKICFGSADDGVIFEVIYGEPNRVEVAYECMGQEGAAFAQLTYDIDMPVILSYRLYYNNVDVTDVYDDGYAEFDLVSPKESSYIEFDERDELFFYEAKKTAVVRVTYYYEKNGKEVSLRSSNTTITAKSLQSYSVSIEEWTIIDDSDSDDIDWTNPVHKITAGSTDHRIVLLLKDTYGTLYSTDSRGEDTSGNIYSLTDSDAFFGALGYSVELASKEIDEVLVEEDGSLEVYEDAKTTTSVYLTLYNEYADDFKEKKVATFSLQILPAPKLSSMKAEVDAITLPIDCVDGFEERFCRTEVKIKLYDQYGEEWDGDADLSLSCNNSDIDEELGGSSGPAYIDSNYILHLDAEDLWEIDKDDSLTFTIKEEEINKRTTVKVTLKKPVYDSEDNLKVNGWEIGAKDVEIALTDDTYVFSSAIEVFQTSKNLNVGLFTNVTLLERSNYTPDKNDAIGEVFIMIIDPKGDVVPIAETPFDLGAYWDSFEKCVRVNVAAPGDGKTMEFLETGKYRVKAIRVTSKDDDGTPNTSSDTAYFTVTENMGNIVIKSLKNNETENYVDDKEDTDSVAKIIEELFRFTLDGKSWEVTQDMIHDVTFTRKEKYIIIKSMELEVPIGDTGYHYIKKIKNVNKTIRHGVYD